jgi:hypothetical protein
MRSVLTSQNVQLDVSQLISGVYIYSYTMHGEPIKQGKLIKL